MECSRCGCLMLKERFTRQTNPLVKEYILKLLLLGLPVEICEDVEGGFMLTKHFREHEGVEYKIVAYADKKAESYSASGFRTDKERFKCLYSQMEVRVPELEVEDCDRKPVRRLLVYFRHPYFENLWSNGGKELTEFYFSKENCEALIDDIDGFDLEISVNNLNENNNDTKSSSKSCEKINIVYANELGQLSRKLTSAPFLHYFRLFCEIKRDCSVTNSLRELVIKHEERIWLYVKSSNTISVCFELRRKTPLKSHILTQICVNLNNISQKYYENNTAKKKHIYNPLNSIFKLFDPKTGRSIFDSQIPFSFDPHTPPSSLINIPNRTNSNKQHNYVIGYFTIHLSRRALYEGGDLLRLKASEFLSDLPAFLASIATLILPLH